MNIIRFGLADCFALLDESTGTNQLQARFYQHPKALIRAAADEAADFYAEIETRLMAGDEIVYAHQYHNHWQAEPTAQIDAETGALQALVFDKVTWLDAGGVERRLQALMVDEAAKCDFPEGLETYQAAGVLSESPGISAEDYEQKIERILAYIAAGDCYQINFTFPWQLQCYGHPIALYQRLMAQQPVPYGALIRWPEGWTLSRSPELFFSKTAQQIMTKPMKGTAAATTDALENAERSAVLSGDGKNRAENLMIVDLLRNDMGRIAEVGSVRVPDLFEVNRFGEVLQMTSTVSATLPSGTSLVTVMDALFPCGSITGAPKRRAMEIIEELEPAARGLYTGSIGWLSSRKQVWEGCSSVVIRTLDIDQLAVDSRAAYPVTMGIGSGIVADSVASDEYAECAQKAKFVTGLTPPCGLIETMRAVRDAAGRYRIPLINRHVLRLMQSAHVLRFPELSELSKQLAHYLEKASSEHAADYLRVRLQVEPSGKVHIGATPWLASDMLVNNPDELPVKLAVHASAIAADNLFRRHKTTVRDFYNQALKAAAEQGWFDYLFFNEHNVLAEGARSNIYIKLPGNDEWLTPRVADGALPGVVRAALLSRGQIDQLPLRETAISREMLHAAEALYISNGFYWLTPAVLV